MNVRSFDPLNFESNMLSSSYPIGDRRLGLKRHFVVAPDGRTEEIGDLERERGRMTQFEIEALHA